MFLNTIWCILYIVIFVYERYYMENLKFNLEEDLNHFEKLWESRPPVDKKKVHSKEKWNNRATSWIKEFDDPFKKKRSDNRLKRSSPGPDRLPPPRRS